MLSGERGERGVRSSLSSGYVGGCPSWWVRLPVPVPAPVTGPEISRGLRKPRRPPRLPRLVTKGMFILGEWWRLWLVLFGGVEVGGWVLLLALCDHALRRRSIWGSRSNILSLSSAEAAVSPFEWPVNFGRAEK